MDPYHDRIFGVYKRGTSVCIGKFITNLYSENCIDYDKAMYKGLQVVTLGRVDLLKRGTQDVNG